MRKLAPAFLTGLVFISLCCGYTTRSALISQYRTIRVAPVDNAIDFTQATRRSFYYPLLEVRIHDAVVNRFLFDGNLRVAPTETADLLMESKLVDYTRGALRYTDNDDVQEYRVQVVLAAVLKDTRADKVLWQKTIVGEATYFVAGTLTATERSAVDEAVEDLARRVVEQTVQHW